MIIPAAEILALACIALPLLCAGLIALVGKRPDLRETITLGVGVLVFACILGIHAEVAQGARPQLILAHFLPGIDFALEVEPLGLIFALVAGFLWPVTTLYSIGYMRAHNEPNQTRFYACFALSIACAMGVAFAANLITLFFFYELLTLATWPLVTHAGTPEARRAGRLYLLILLSTSIVFQLLAIAWTWQAAGSVDFRLGGILEGRLSHGIAIALFCLFAFGIGKAALMPFHLWLPAAMVAPTPVSALLHAVAVVKAGVFTLLKVAVYIFGPDFLMDSGGGRIIAFVAGFTIVVASVVAIYKDNLKARLAWSTISHLSYVILGACLATAWGVAGAALHIVMHAFGKITLFFCAGAVLVVTHRKRIGELDGLGRRMPLTMGAFAIGSLCIIGLPPLGGMWSKWSLALATVHAEQWLLLAALLLSSMLSMAYLMVIPVRAFLYPPAPAESNGSKDGSPAAGGARSITEAPTACLAAIGITSIGCVALFVFPDPFFNLIDQVVPLHR
ncbi:MAG: monovalent cation/H+ antiporter subunit D family protein [Ectothiorhodospiraceae bacterium AqS1]|nr:monovalent cation/H+ antiporter subunit D family protein [Ectothiorhodospiraceae bacterium AqS1]